jgi:hypothetical protein
MTMSQYTDYANQVKALDRDTWLGMLSWYTVAEDLRVAHDDLKTILGNVGLAAHMPRVPSDSDVFRRTCSAAQRKRVPTPDGGVFMNFLVRDPGSKDANLCRRIVRELVDASNQRLGYEEVGEVCFDRDTGNIRTRLYPSKDPVARKILAEIRRNYLRDRGTLNGYAVRELIRRVLVNANATNVRYPGGGVYFLSADHAGTVASLEDMAEALGDDVYVHSLPLPDDRKQRDMLKKAFEAESVDRANAMIAEIADLLKGEKVSAERAATYVTALTDLRGKLSEYSGLLETGLSSTAASVKILQRQVKALLKKVEH